MKIQIDYRWLKLSAKRSYQNLKNSAPLISGDLKAKILVSKRFYDHIAHHKRRRNNPTEIVNRLLLIPFLPEIVAQGAVVDIRDQSEGKFYQLKFAIHDKKASVVILKDKAGVYRLVSCFFS